jgi:VWFA-related protein
MRRLAMLLAGAMVLPAAAVMAARSLEPLDQDPVASFRSGTDAVSVDVSVRRGKRPVTGLKASDFEIFDNGVRQEILDISYEKLPIDVTVLLDVSTSVTGPMLEALRRGVGQLREGLEPEDRLKLVTFDMRIRRLADFSSAAASTDAALESLAGTGTSAIFDALVVALTSPSTASRRQLIVLFSDGVDSSSVIDPPLLTEVAKRSAPTIAAVLASPTRRRVATVYARSALAAPMTVDQLYDQLANETGGVVLRIATGNDLGSAFRRVLDDFRASYVVYFSPHGVPRGGLHTLDVRVRGEGVDVRARRGYGWR